MILQPRFRDLAAALISALLLLFAWAAQAQTTTIENTAQASWSRGGQTFSTNSNTVSFGVVRQPITIDTLHLNPGDGQPATYKPSLCGGSPISLPGFGNTGASLPLSPTSSLHAGEILFFTIVAPAANRDPAAVDSIQATLSTTRGDREIVTAYETAPNSGKFLGAIPTVKVPPAPVQGDCRLSVAAGDTVSIEVRDTTGAQILAAIQIVVLADPYGLVFDSEDGTPIDGAAVTLINVATGAPAQVFADDGVTPWPSTVISGQSVTDGAGNVYTLAPGEYRFPLAALGTYRLAIIPPAPYTAPSTAGPGQLAGLTRPDGSPLLIVLGSYGGPVAVSSPTPVRVDIPLDRPGLAVGLTKAASRTSAAPGDAVFYTIRVTNTDRSRSKRLVVLNDTPSPWLRLRSDSIRVDGTASPAAITIAPDGRSLRIALGDIAPGATRIVTYAMSVRADAPPGQAVNRADAVDSRGLHAIASAALRVESETIASRMTIVGRITDGGCRLDVPHRGIPGVRVMLEDGSFALTDSEGRYHFEGVVPGTHVVQAAAQTLPAGGFFTDCTRSTRSAGKANSRFVTGQGGSLVQVDFSATVPEVAPLTASIDPSIQSDRQAAGGDTDWLALGDGPTGFLFPAIDHNPRAPAVRVVIRHRQGQSVELYANGKPVDPIAFDGAKASSWGFAVSIWRGIPLNGETTHLHAVVRNADGLVSDQLDRDVHFSAAPARVEWVRERSRLTADGASRPVIAVRVLDRLGRPVHAGLTGGFQINAPYESAAQLDAMQTRQLSGLDRAAPTWTVKGDDGIALIELAPTMVSGPLHIDFVFADDQTSRGQTLNAWIVPGAQKWTLIGLAEGSVGSRSIADHMERSGRFDSDLGDHARIAFYAKGKVKGRYVLTLAYDSAKAKDDQRLLGTIDPNAYYTVFADGSDRRFDAASREKLYVRIESSAFYALYGDFVTGFDQTKLAGYQRTLTGGKVEGQFGAVHVGGFVASTGNLHVRDEIMGAGVSGPYRLSNRSPIANSESVRIEVRDRFRSELVVESRPLTRFVDYDIDLLSGTITFKEPILSRDAQLNPQFIVIDYDVDQASGGKLNAGVRGDVTIMNGRVRIGATALTDTGSTNGSRAYLGGVDVKAKLGADTELRGELAASRNHGDTAKAWLVEVEHHDASLDVLGYVRSVDDMFGLGQLNGAEQGRRKAGIDARVRITPDLSVTTSVWRDESMTDGSSRTAAQISALYHVANSDLRLGLSHFADKLADGSKGQSTTIEVGATRRLFDNRLEISATANFALGKAESIDLPARYRLGLRYALTQSVKLTGSYEIADGEAVKARTARVGVEVSPWTGARMIGSLGQQDIAENGKRSFAAFGLSQSLQVSRTVTIDATLDNARTLGRLDASKLVNLLHPASSGGVLGESGSVTEDFTAVTLGGTYHRELWSATLRGEYRDGQFAVRKGVTLGAIRQLGEGSAIGGGFTWTRADAVGGASSEVMDGSLSLALRPTDGPFALLGKVEYRSDAVNGAIAGEAGPAGRTELTVDGNAQSRRIITSLSADWSLKGNVDGQRVQRSEIGLFGALRHNFDQVDGFDLRGTTLLGGLDLRIGIGSRLELGSTATVRHSLTDGTTSFAFGPQVGFLPTNGMLVTVGYNVTGFRDRDFAASRNTTQGPFVAVKLKFDADSFGFLGLGRK